MPIDAMLFDVAGTLLTKPSIPFRISEALHAVGIDIPTDEIARRHALVSEIVPFPDRTDRAFYAEFNGHLLRALGVPAEPRLVEDIHERCREAAWEPAPGAGAVGGMAEQVGVVSNSDGDLADRLEMLGVRFDPIVGSAAAGVRKPDPAIFRIALERLGAAPGRVAHVGDSLRLDVEPAAAAGLIPILVDPLNLYRSYPGYRIGALTDLPALLPSVD